MPRSGPRKRAAATRTARGAARVLAARRTPALVQSAICCRPPRAPSSSRDCGTLERSARAAAGAGTGAAAPPRAQRGRRRGSTRRAALPQLEFFNGLRRLCRRRPRIRHHPRRRPVDARALDQRDRQSSVRMSGVGGRHRQHLVAECAAKISSRRGPTIRSATSPAEVIYIRDEDERRSVERDSAAHSRAVLFLRRSPRLRLQPVRAQLARHLPGSAAIRAARGFA